MHEVKKARNKVLWSAPCRFTKGKWDLTKLAAFCKETTGLVDKGRAVAVCLELVRPSACLLSWPPRQSDEAGAYCMLFDL